MKYLFLIISLACIALSGIYTLVIAPSQTIRIPDDWSFEAEYLGDLVYIDPDQNIPDTATVNVYRRSMRVVEWEPDQAVIEDVFETKDVYSGQVTWSTTLRFNVNPEDGTIISHPGRPEATGMQYVLPRQTKKTDYEFFNYTLWPVTLNFEREDSLGGLDVYVFTYKGLIDFTELTRKAEYAASATLALGATTAPVWVIAHHRASHENAALCSAQTSSRTAVGPVRLVPGIQCSLHQHTGA